jgi:hypothetical protein
MKTKDQVVFDIGNDKFMYLKRDEGKKVKKVDLIDLNKRLNQTKIKNFYNNVKVIFFLLFCLGLFTVISLKF